MNTIVNPIKTALALVASLLLLAGSHTAMAQNAAHDHGNAEAKQCQMMASGKECPMKSDDAAIQECPMMASGQECPMMQQRSEGHDHSAHVADEELSVAAATLTDGVQVIAIRVGPGGYEPSAIELEAGIPAQLVFTRTSGSGCMNQVQIPDLGVGKTDLPLDEAVTVAITPDEAGTFRFACGMDMVRGTILVTG